MKLRKLHYSLVLAVLMFCSLISLAQNRVITGRVTDPAGNGISGVSVTVKGTSEGTITTADGSYTLPVPANATTLVFSSVGYGTQEATINGNTVNATLQTSAGNLNEIVIIGYGTRQRKDLTGSITTVTSEDFQKGVITTPEQLIAGKAAGVQVVSNGGAPGAGSTIRIRGGSSLNASNDPLIVVDGVPLSNSGISGAANALSLINPNDIESFNILKDASATAIYGSRASNGVIIITTKKGRRGKTRVNFSSQYSVAKNTNEVDVLNGEQFRQLVNEKGDAADIALLGTENTNWQDVIYQTAIATDNNLSVSGGIGRMPYRISLGYLNQDGVLKTGNLKRTSASLNLSPKFFDDHLSVDLNVKGAVSKNRFANEGAIGAAVSFDPTQPIYSGGKRFGGYFEWLDDNGDRVPLSTLNPMALLRLRIDRSTVQRSIGNAQFDYKFHFLPELHANLNLGYDISKGEGTVFVPDSAASDYLQGGLMREYAQERKDRLMEAYLNYDAKLGGNSKLDVLAGYSYQDFQTTNHNFPSMTARGDTISTSIPKFVVDKPQNTLISFYGRINYSYKSRYMFSASLRRDGSSRFAPAQRWGMFPAFALAWNIKNESFLESSSALSGLKLRLSYGVTGQQEGIGIYDYISYYALSNNTAEYQIGDQFYSMYRPGGYYENRKWEQTATYNAGLDYGFANNRISGTLDFYVKKTEDLLNLIGQPAGTNFANQVIANVGTMENKGVEFSINVQPVRNKTVVWDVNFNATYNQNEITNLTLAPDPTYPGNQYGSVNGGTGSVIQINSVGFPRGSFYTYQQVYDEAGNPIENLFVDRNADGTINENDLYQYKNADPKMYFGFSTSVTAGKWDAGLALRANVGNYMYNNVYSNLGRYFVVAPLGGFLNNLSSNYLETGFEGGNVKQMVSDYYIQNASFLRMDNIHVGYDVGKVLSNQASLRLGASIQNVFTVTKYKGLDPEINGGIDNNFYPRPRTYVLGLNLDF